MYFCHPLPTLKQLNQLCSNFPERIALRLLPELQHLHHKDESRRVPRHWPRIFRAEAPWERREQRDLDGGQSLSELRSQLVLSGPWTVKVHGLLRVQFLTHPLQRKI